MAAYYNEIDPACVRTLERHINNGDLPAGFVDSRSIEEVQPHEVKGYNECHFFAGIGGFPLGFSRAYVPDGTTVWTGGFPCQDLSVAGKRKGLAGKRSGLFFEFHRLITGCWPDIVILENVPGLLSSNEGRDFAIVLGGLTGILPDIPEEGWGNAGLARGPLYKVAYRVLDAQFFGVPQRRRRVFIVGSLGDGRAAEVLFESESVAGNTPPRRESGKDVAYSLRASPSHSGDKGDGGINQTMIPIGIDSEYNADENMIGALRSHQSGGSELFVMAHGQANAEVVSDGSPSLTNNHEAPILLEMSHADDVIRVSGDTSPTLQARMGTGGNQIPLVGSLGEVDGLAYQIRGGGGRGGKGYLGSGKTAFSLKASQKQYLGIRRLMPIECERLQGFPDNWTAEQPDTPRYRQCGNAVAEPVVRWIARRIRK